VDTPIAAPAGCSRCTVGAVSYDVSGAWHLRQPVIGGNGVVTSVSGTHVETCVELPPTSLLPIFWISFGVLKSDKSDTADFTPLLVRRHLQQLLSWHVLGMTQLGLACKLENKHVTTYKESYDSYNMFR
jgi:hypothetical protein